MLTAATITIHSKMVAQPVTTGECQFQLQLAISVPHMPVEKTRSVPWLPLAWPGDPDPDNYGTTYSSEGAACVCIPASPHD